MAIKILQSIILCLILAVTTEAHDLDNLLHKAAKQQNSAFVNDYLKEAFSQWQQRYPLRLFKCDSIFRKGSYDEAWLSLSHPTALSNNKIAILVTRGQNRKIVDIRKLLLTQENKFSALEQTVAEFIERFSWYYEIGEDNFLLDFVYPVYINLHYKGLSDKISILKDLRRQYKNELAISLVDWENRETDFMIKIILESPLQPLQIAIDIQKYMTAQFFDLEDKVTRVQALSDSIDNWLHARPIVAPSKPFIVSAFSAKNAIATLIDSQFQNYNTSILQESNHTTIVEFAMEPIYGINPIGMRYKFITTPLGKNKFTLDAEWLRNHAFQAASHHSSQIIPSDKSSNNPKEPAIDFILNRIVHRYLASGLPAIFRSKINDHDFTKGSITLNGNKPSILKLDQGDSYTKLLQKLAQDKRPYFFIREVNKEEDKLTISAYILWQNKNQLWHHSAKIYEIYQFVNNAYIPEEFMIHIYPFIHTENVQAFFAASNSEESHKRRVKVLR